MLNFRAVGFQIYRHRPGVPNLFFKGPQLLNGICSGAATNNSN